MCFPDRCTVIHGAPRHVAGTPKLFAGAPRLVVSAPRLVVGAPRLVVSAPRLVIGTPRCSKWSLWHSEVFSNSSESLPWYSCTSHQWFQWLWRPARMPLYSLILSWNWRIQVYTPHPLRHSWSLPVTKIHFADELPGTSTHLSASHFLLWNQRTQSPSPRPVSIEHCCHLESPPLQPWSGCPPERLVICEVWIHGTPKLFCWIASWHYNPKLRIITWQYA